MTLLQRTLRIGHDGDRGGGGDDDDGDVFQSVPSLAQQRYGCVAYVQPVFLRCLPLVREVDAAEASIEAQHRRD